MPRSYSANDVVTSTLLQARAALGPRRGSAPRRSDRRSIEPPRGRPRVWSTTMPDAAAQQEDCQGGRAHPPPPRRQQAHDPGACRRRSLEPLSLCAGIQEGRWHRPAWLRTAPALGPRPRAACPPPAHEHHRSGDVLRVRHLVALRQCIQGERVASRRARTARRHRAGPGEGGPLDCPSP
jgi:hypothetical protein